MFPQSLGMQYAREKYSAIKKQGVDRQRFRRFRESSRETFFLCDQHLNDDPPWAVSTLSVYC